MRSAVTDTPRSRGHKKRERTRRMLLDAAIEVVAERGEAFSFSDITTRAGVASGTIYNYFATRDDLVDALLPDVFAAFTAESDLVVDEPDPQRRFAVITALVLRRAETTPDSLRLLLRVDAVHRAAVEGVLDHLRADLSAGAASGRFRDDVDAATVDVVVGGILMAARRITDGPVEADYGPRVIAQLLRSLGVDADVAASVAADAVATASRV